MTTFEDIPSKIQTCNNVEGCKYVMKRNDCVEMHFLINLMNIRREREAEREA